MPRNQDGIKQQPMTARQRSEKGRRMAFANISQHGTDGLRDHLRGGFMRRFEQQVDAEDAALRDSNPAAYHERVHALLSSYMREMSAKSVASRAAKAAAKRAAEAAQQHDGAE
ncbi:MAG: hypothetical protein ACXWQR_04935 [Ktedonobacterales bacterium]